jgi:hypothetical protein
MVDFFLKLLCRIMYIIPAESAPLQTQFIKQNQHLSDRFRLVFVCVGEIAVITVFFAMLLLLLIVFGGA